MTINANDIMIDLETLDNSATSAILSIGAVRCNLISGKIVDKFYRVIELEGQPGTIGAATFYFWLNQSSGARQALNIPGKILHTQLCDQFNNWLVYEGNNPKNYRLWGNGASFDNSILRQFYNYQKIEFPIPYWQDRDVRTLRGFYPENLFKEWRLNNQREGTYHNSLDDAIYQVNYCSNILQELGVQELY